MGARGLTLFVAIAFASLCIGFAPSRTDAVPIAHTAGKVLSAERLIRQCANRHRISAGLPTLQPDPVLDRAARLHARRMRWKRFFDHVDDRGWGPQERVDALASGWAAGENIAAGYRSVAAACQGWMGSSGHRANILGDSYTAIGTGYAPGPGGPYYVQVFAFAIDENVDDELNLTD